MTSFGAHALGRPDVEQGAGFAGNGPLHHQQIAVAVNFQDCQPTGGDLLAAEATGHALAGIDPPRRRAGACGTWFPVILGTVGHWAAAETVTFLVAREATPHGVAADVDFLAGFEITDGDRATEFQALNGIDAVFAKVTQQLIAGFGQVALCRAVDQLLAGAAETDLHRGIAVGVIALQLGDSTGTRLDQGDRDGFALLVEELGHSQLLPKDADGHGR